MSTDPETYTEWGVRYISPHGSHVSETRDEAVARRWARQRPLPGCSIELLRRTVTISDWQEAPS
jgi:hypothetical protein